MISASTVHARSPLALVFGGLLVLSGCASFSPDAGLSTSQDYAGSELHKEVSKVSTDEEELSARARAEFLLRATLTPDSAVQIALLRNKELQAAFSDLGVSEARYVQATLPPSPRISITSASGAAMAYEFSAQALISLLDLATLPARASIAEQNFRAAQYRAAEEMLRLAAETRRQFYRAVAASQQVQFLEQALATAGVASTLATGLGEAGNLNKLEQARENAFYIELGAQVARARIDERTERERLIRQLGLWGRDVGIKLPRSLPPLPKSAASSDAVEQRAVLIRVDLQAARHDLEALAQQYGLTSVSRFVNAFDIGPRRSDEGSSTTSNSQQAESGAGSTTRTVDRRRGVALDLQIPIYDFGEAATREAQQRYEAAVNRLANRAVIARSEVREAYSRYRGEFDLARCFNSRSFPGIDPLVIRQGDKVRIRFGNLTMTNHPIHIHGFDFKVTGTDGGWVDPNAGWPEVSVDVAVGQMRAVEFYADQPGDWAMHCHKSHHTMNAMGHSVRTYIGVNMRAAAKQLQKIVPGYMPMGNTGGGAMAEMQVPLPENTLPAMSGVGQFGSIEMGGMFTTLKVRPGIARDDYSDPGFYQNPAGTVAYEWKGDLPEAKRASQRKNDVRENSAEFKVVDPRTRRTANRSHEH